MTGYQSAGVLTFLFTDLEDSTRLWEEHPHEMRAALSRHDGILRAVVEAHDGRFVKTTGDGVHAVFEIPANALGAALAVQRAVNAERWPDELGSLKVLEERLGEAGRDHIIASGELLSPDAAVELALSER